MPGRTEDNISNLRHGLVSALTKLVGRIPRDERTGGGALTGVLLMVFSAGVCPDASLWAVPVAGGASL